MARIEFDGNTCDITIIQVIAPKREVRVIHSLGGGMAYTQGRPTSSVCTFASSCAPPLGEVQLVDDEGTSVRALVTNVGISGEGIIAQAIILGPA